MFKGGEKTWLSKVRNKVDPGEGGGVLGKVYQKSLSL